MTEAGGAGSDPGRKFHQLNTDGGVIAATGQAAGEAAIGVILRDPDGSEVHHISARIGWAINHHIAEYRALITGLRLARGHGIDDLRVFLDSALVVNHVNRESRVGADYIDLCAEARSLLGQFVDIQVAHVPRRENREADALANRALRPKTTGPGGVAS
jgi:ribonuclease HI